MRAPAYILARPAAARPPRISPTRKMVRNEGQRRAQLDELKCQGGKHPTEQIDGDKANGGTDAGCEVKLK